MLGLYIHVPFCLKKCRYCDFLSYIYKEEAVQIYLDGLIKEMQLLDTLLQQEEKIISSVYLGGGTPTCLSRDALTLILESASKYFSWLPEIEITVEANPGTIDYQKLHALRVAGVNRLSLGVQAFQENMLAVLGRIHTAQDVFKAVKIIRKSGFDNLNLDLIFGIPRQTLEDWKESLHLAISLNPEHVSLYWLLLEEGTILKQDVEEGKLLPCSEEIEVVMYKEACEIMEVNGFNHYEISNWARPGRECQHNLNYWKNHEYLGLGPGAHSFIGGYRYFNIPVLEDYLERLDKGKLPIAGQEKVNLQLEATETAFLGLRLREGLDLDNYAARFGCSFEERYEQEIELLRKNGLIEVRDRHLKLTSKALPVANEVFVRFI